MNMDKINVLHETKRTLSSNKASAPQNTNSGHNIWYFFTWCFI